MRVYDEMDRFHRLAFETSQRVRYGLLRQPAQDPRKILARSVEADVYDRLIGRGYHVTRTGYHEHFDLLVDGLRVEVKAATWSGGRYQAALRGNDADVLVFGCALAEGMRYFVIPFEQARGLTSIAVWSVDPTNYAGRWRGYLEAWRVVDELLAAGQ